jgi:mannitol-1-phosphate 5-dehydrogenase
MTHIKSSYSFDNRKIVIFGAGRIGRSFIGQLFSRSGFEVVFVDTSKQLTDTLTRRKQYKVIFKNNTGDKILHIKNVRGVCLYDSEKVTRELATSGIAALCVGQQGLTEAVPAVARALVLRRELFGDQPLDIIIAENMRNSEQYLSAELSRYLPQNFPLGQIAGLVETSIGKMVPIMSQKDIEEDPLQVIAEPYNTLIVAKNGFRNPVPKVFNLEHKENIKAWVDRKLFIHNLGHATTAYLGFRKHPHAVYIYDLLDDPEILEAVRRTMMQSADILIALYPVEFTHSQLTAHIDDLLCRFRNKALGDTVFRVGCDLYRKLSPDDRLSAPIKSAISLNKPFDLILNSLIAGISFRARDENGNFFPTDKIFFSEAELGINHVLRNICGLEISV